MDNNGQTKLEAELADILSGIPSLTGESVVDSPDNPWLSNPKYKARLQEVHNLLDQVKNGGKFIVIAIDADEQTKFFTANISKPSLLSKLSQAITKVADKLKKDDPTQH